MKRVSFLLLCAITLAFCGAVSVNATTITTSASGNMNGADYGFSFSITDEDLDGDSTTFAATLLNLSDDALIDLFAFNMNAILGTNFIIENVNPNWSFSAGSGPILFDYVGESNTQSDRISPSDSLTFDFNFDDSFFAGLGDPFSLWTGTSESTGNAIGGGDDSGQVAVSFQGIGGGTFANDSDLLASNWENSPAPVPEPATILLVGFGLVGLAGFGRKKLKNS
jgi:hypothetical protein